MANKKYVEQRNQAAREKTLLTKKRRLRFFPLIILLITVVILLLMLTDWAAVYNTSIAGNEVRISGFNCVSAGLSGNYTSENEATFGNMAMPFNYYAKTFLRTLCALTVAVFFVVIAHMLIEVFATITNKQGAFNILAIVFTVAEAALFIACYAVAISMKNAEILSGYCQGNPACSIQSQSIIPAVFAILSLAVPILAMIGEHKIKKETAPAEQAPAESAGDSSDESKGKGKKNQKRRSSYMSGKPEGEESKSNN